MDGLPCCQTGGHFQAISLNPGGPVALAHSKQNEIANIAYTGCPQKSHFQNAAGDTVHWLNHPFRLEIDFLVISY